MNASAQSPVGLAASIHGASGFAYTEGMSEPAKPKRRWCQYSLRTLLVLMLLASIGMSWVSVKVRPQWEAANAIKERGAYVGWDEPSEPRWLRSLLGDDFFKNVIFVSFQSATDPEMKHLKALSQLQGVSLYKSQVTDAGLENLKGLRKLRELDLNFTQITGSGLEHLKGLSQLQKLMMRVTPVTDAGLEHLKGLARLELLWLEGTKVTDAGLKHLKGLPHLHELRLDGTQVTDAGLEDLKGLSQLERLSLHGTQVTEEGVKTLRQSLRTCYIQLK